MGFDAFGPSQVPRPPKPVDTSSFLSEVARRQRIDDRGIAINASSVAAVAARTPSTQISTGTLNGSGIGSATFVVPALGASVSWVHAVAKVDCAASGDDAELWVNFSGSGIQGHFDYGKQPPSSLGLQAVGASTGGRATPGTTIALNVYCPIEAGESFTVTFYASPAR